MSNVLSSGAYNEAELGELRDFYRDSLLNDTLPFWLPRSIDEEHGGYASWHRMIHKYAHETFHDAEHGEWFGYLHRDGRISTAMKGNHYKGPFHLPRMQWYCWRLLEGKS